MSGIRPEPGTPAFDRLARIAARLLGAPVGLVTMVDEERQRMPGAFGIDLREVPLTHSLCRNVVATGAPVIAPDARRHALLKDSPALDEFGIGAYAGVPLRAPSGEVLGAVCALEMHPRPWSAEQVELLEDLAHAAASELGAHLAAEEARAAEQDVRALSERLQAIVDAAPMVLFVLDREGRLTSMEGGRAGDPRLARDELIGRRVQDVCATAPRIVENCRRALAGELVDDLVPYEGLYFQTRYTPLPGGGVLGVATDVTERHRSEQRLAHLAYHDGLTDLPNRACLELHLGRELALVRRDATREVALLSLDLDGFKMVNDSLGHAAGDVILREVAERLRSITRTGDVLARQGGDEFSLLLAGGLDAAEAAASRTLDALAAPFGVDEAEFEIGASVGIAVAPEHGVTVADLLRHADVAMYEAKATGRCAAVYAPGRDDARRKLTLTRRLRRALEDGELLLHYQPVQRLATGETVAVEALLRWEDPEHGLVPPAAFIPHAEESGLIEPIGEWVVEEACRQLGAWRDLGLDPRVAFNVAPRQLHRSGFAEMVEATIRRHGLDGSRLTMELTESAAMQDPQRIVPLLHALRGLGLQIAIDDFGAHHSSLGRLRDLPVDVLKIDRAFLRGVPGDPSAEAFIRAILELTRALGVHAVAEGIERETQRAFLTAERCGLGQGFHLGRPAPAAEATALLLAAAADAPARPPAQAGAMANASESAT